MNILLSCCAVKGKGAFVLLKDGRSISKESFIINKGSDSTLKEYIFEALIRGLRYAKDVVNHDDLIIELPNAHLVEWLNGEKEYKGYEQYLDVISDCIEVMDCRYKFIKTDVKRAKEVLKEEPKKEKLEGVLGLLDMGE